MKKLWRTQARFIREQGYIWMKFFKKKKVRNDVHTLRLIYVKLKIIFKINYPLTKRKLLISFYQQ